MTPANPVFCALDTSVKARATELLNKVAPYIGGVKIGMEYFYATGIAGYQAIARHNVPIFLDLKLHDIPNTVAAAIRTLAPLEPAILNVHASGGQVMMRASVEAANDYDGKKPMMIAVTILTSLEGADLHQMGLKGSPEAQVLRLAEMAQNAGMAGVVCSAHEIEPLRKACGPDFKLIVPGIRPHAHARHDQKRIMTPEQARHAGADILVIGRAILNAKDPVETAARIQQSLAKIR